MSQKCLFHSIYHQCNARGYLSRKILLAFTIDECSFYFMNPFVLRMVPPQATLLSRRTTQEAELKLKIKVYIFIIWPLQVTWDITFYMHV